MPNKRSWTDKELIDNVPLSTCWKDLYERLNLSPNSPTVKRRIKELGLDVTHFDRHHWNRGSTLDLNRTSKKCGLCDLTKKIDEFHLKNKNSGVRSARCIECQAAYSRNHYSEKKQYYLDKNKKWTIKRKIEFYEWLKTQSCKDCGNDDFRVLELDHLRDKEFDISQQVANLNFETLKKEIDKCDVVCSNCHKIRTAERGDFYQYLE